MKQLDRFSRFENGVYKLLVYFMLWGAPLLVIFLVDMFFLKDLSPFIRYPLWAVLIFVGFFLGFFMLAESENFFISIRKMLGMKPLRELEAEAEMSSAHSEPENILAFNWLTLKVLNDLYDAFPQSINIESLRFTISTLYDIGTQSRQADYLQHLPATIRWLKDESFIRYESDDAGNFRKVILTLKGLTVLGYVPSSLSSTDKKEPMIAKIKRVLAKGTEGAATDAVKTILVKLFALAVSGTAG
jgi:hypothetical protein